MSGMKGKYEVTASRWPATKINVVDSSGSSLRTCALELTQDVEMFLVVTCEFAKLYRTSSSAEKGNECVCTLLPPAGPFDGGCLCDRNGSSRVALWSTDGRVTIFELSNAADAGSYELVGVCQTPAEFPDGLMAGRAQSAADSTG